ncbi:hypothetical protein [Gloeothece verrucosa]|uniref:Uncharacterized protein n=1 Tax=Gloeothece verrucosa (strain PCC 7822) TaxID=497965 RepID=E0UCM9_GLOV7|nr:hypothetical protein [Gloeothece verrucosa]ADN14576.1 hypothetical protein Cyan7822_2605 [Gloeothece verrucosa PCC 7822]ADN15223.1 hypothetical protein Cyan7822_3273 [Gloeothece verrucosa PCC 7822]
MFIGFVGFPPIIAPPPSAIGHIPGAPNGTVQPPNKPPPGGYKPSGGGGAWRAGANAAAVAAGSYLGWQASKWLLKKFFNQSSEITPEAQERAAIAKARAAQNQGGFRTGPAKFRPLNILLGEGNQPELPIILNFCGMTTAQRLALPIYLAQPGSMVPSS